MLWTIPKILVPGQPENANDINTNFADLRDNVLNGNIDALNFTTNTKNELGVNGDGTIRRGFSQINTLETTNSLVPADLATVGPSVTITVPTNGLVYVLAAVDITSVIGQTAAVELVEDVTNLTQILSTISTVAQKVSTQPGSTNGTTQKFLAGALVFPTSGGAHTYKLKYFTSGGTVSFANRQIWVKTEAFS